MNEELNELLRDKPELARIGINHIQIGQPYQRDSSVERIDRMSKAIDDRLLETLLISRRDDGMLYCLDGKHRISALRVASMFEYKVPCRIFYGLTFEDEAWIFAHTQGSSARPRQGAALGRDQGHRGRLGDGDRKAHGTQRNKVFAIAAMQRIYRENGADNLRETLAIVKEAWDGEPWSLRFDILGGVSNFLRRYDKIDREHLIDRLHETSDAELEKVRESVKTLYCTGAGSSSNSTLAATARSILHIYNNPLWEDRLPDWDAGRGRRPRPNR